MSSDLVYAQREIDNLINLLADARTENMKLNEYIKRQAMDIILCKSGNDTLHEENTRLRAANRILRLGLNGLVDSNDVAEIADAIAAGEAIDWDRYPPTARAALKEGMTSPDEREDCTGLEDSSTANPCGREDCEEEGRT